MYFKRWMFQINQEITGGKKMSCKCLLLKDLTLQYYKINVREKEQESLHILIKYEYYFMPVTYNISVNVRQFLFYTQENPSQRD